ncbi:cob(I)yrinic acid a,c-diamide adenosyltransferase [Sphaerobacter thermophilus]|jgi:cob(I)alamin adenosyltransferase|uniref:corrinoid adenosyltransferase n=1 Tax=Sphaerobacter thermophilus (strain ATCC 49802 / DSM 20745 / KCCM 41009 / NCIMB 13125 / S 6022) TaxID=479434 RepID=D1C322_SPHTD|nr:cob(I)yrinic acid a,c-diamide adenosyltransferase [Sphaerobacter thermophilus]ACZ38639.1 cob(I)alamin adenosyltransferase [Sphaerobacter thermophilus DSM 20745]PZN64859.1 MAG: ATP--corrinoid adenosyltransferase [Sphaerobacter thermophilus]
MAGQSTEKNGQSTQRGYLMLLVGHERATSDAALGIALRAAGHNLRVHIIEFLKGGRDRGEVAAVSFLTGVTLTQYGTVPPQRTVEDMDGPAIAPDRLEAALREAQVHVRQRVTNILILDGLLTLVGQGLVEESRILDLVNESAPWLDIVVSGATVTDTLKEAADSVTMMEIVKSSERAEQPLRRGIHY